MLRITDFKDMTLWTDEMEITTFIGDGNASNEENWDNGLPTSKKQAVLPDGINCEWDIDTFSIPILIEGASAHITIAPNCFFGGECYAPESIIFYVENLDRPPPGYIGVGNKDYKYSVFQKKWVKLFPDGLQAGAVNTWSNAGVNNLYSDDANWSLGHKPAGTEDVIIPDTSGIGKCTMDENSAADLASFTVQASGEFELVTFILDVNSNITLTGTFTRGTGTLQLGGGAQQDVTSGGNALYHVIVTGANTIYYTKDSTEIFDTDIQAGATFEVDAVSEGGALSISFSDIASSGFKEVASFDGTFLCQGDVTNGVTITSTGAPPTNFWRADAGTGAVALLNFTYTTIEYFNANLGNHADVTWDNVTIQNYGGSIGVLIELTPIISNLSIDGGSSANAVQFFASVNINNLVITNATTDIFFQAEVHVELTNSNFDATSVTFSNTAATLVADTFDDTANDWRFWGGSTHTRVKSDITNDFTSSDNVTIQTGTLTVDEAAAHTNLTIKSGGTFDVNGGQTETVTASATVTVESGGTLDWVGSSGSLVTLRSGTPGTQWVLVVQAGGILNVDFVDVQDCDASGGPKIDATNGNSVGKHQNNANWSFPRPNVHAFGFSTVASRPKR